MIRNIKVKMLNLIREKPLICVPISGSSLEEVVWEIEEMQKIPCDLIEWRTDFFVEDVVSVLRNVRAAADDTLLL